MSQRPSKSSIIGLSLVISCIWGPLLSLVLLWFFDVEWYWAIIPWVVEIILQFFVYKCLVNSIWDWYHHIKG